MEGEEERKVETPPPSIPAYARHWLGIVPAHIRGELELRSDLYKPLWNK